MQYHALSRACGSLYSRLVLRSLIAGAGLLITVSPRTLDLNAGIELTLDISVVTTSTRCSTTHLPSSISRAALRRAGCDDRRASEHWSYDGRRSFRHIIESHDADRAA